MNRLSNFPRHYRNVLAAASIVLLLVTGCGGSGGGGGGTSVGSVAFNASRTTVAPGESVTLTWSARDAYVPPGGTGCTLVWWYGAAATSVESQDVPCTGSLQFRPSWPSSATYVTLELQALTSPYGGGPGYESAMVAIRLLGTSAALARSVVSGDSHSVALDGDGDVWAWGLGTGGQIGDGATSSRRTPVRASLPFTSRVTDVYAGPEQSFAIDARGTAWSWGENEHGLLGTGSPRSADEPREMDFPPGRGIQAISLGERHGLALDVQGGVWGWGDNNYGQLGSGAPRFTRSPVPVAIPSGAPIAAIAAGGQHSLALDSFGGLWVWGSGTRGQLGLGDNGVRGVPSRLFLPTSSRVVAIAASNATSYAIDASGQAWSWGNGSNGELGNGMTAGSPVPTRIAMPGSTRFAEIDARSNFAIALDSSGGVWAWGYGAFGQLGSGDSGTQTSPTRVRIPSGTRALDIAAGEKHAHAVDADGQVWSWGYGREWQLGNGTSTSRYTPVPVLLD